MSVGLTTPRVRAHRAQKTAAEVSQKPWRPWKKLDENNAAEKLLIPLPVPHPVHINIAIYNRDAEHPIPLDSELVWDILKSIEDCQSSEAMVSLLSYNSLKFYWIKNKLLLIFFNIGNLGMTCRLMFFLY